MSSAGHAAPSGRIEAPAPRRPGHNIAMKLLKRLAVILLLCGNQAVAGPDLPPAVSQLLKQYKLPADSLSVYIREYGADEALLSVNAATPRSPASVIKLLTTYAGLALLGPDYHWQTHIHLDGELNNGTLNGNLVIEGGGDPFLVRETFWHLLFTLRNRGLRHITGDLLIDNEMFAEETGSVADFDNKPYRVYNTFPAATLLNFRAHQFHFIPLGSGVHVYADPPAANLKIRNRLRPVAGACRGRHRQIGFNVSRQGPDTVVAFSGDYPRRCKNRALFRAVLAPDAYVYGVFKALWQDLGGTLGGGIGRASHEAGTAFYSLPSRPLGDIITYINKHSNNVMARQLLLTIGSEMQAATGSKEAGRAVIGVWLDQIGIAAPELFIDNGSGLSRDSRISAETLALLLQHALQSPYQPEFLASLPLVGVDGTVRKRLKGRIPPGSARIKTGIIDDVRTMAGYVKARSNRHYIVVALQNHKGIHQGAGTQVQDALLEWLYRQ